MSDMQNDTVYTTFNELSDDLTNVTGDREYGNAAAMAYAIYYKNLVIDTVKYQRGFIDEQALRLNRNISWEHAKRHSEMLSANMIAAGKKRPKDVAAHHIVAWNDGRAAKSRIRLAAYGIDIDHEANGVFLPRFEKHCPHDYLPDAYAHTAVHTNTYFFNVEFLLESTIAEGLGMNAIITTLRDISEELSSGEFELKKRIARG